MILKSEKSTTLEKIKVEVDLIRGDARQLLPIYMVVTYVVGCGMSWQSCLTLVEIWYV